MLHRTIALAATALVAVGATAQAQMTGDMRTVSFGIMAGVNFANVGGDDVDDSDRRTGIQAGVYVDVPVANGVSFRPELLYSMQGAKSDDIDGKGTDGELKLDYVQLPVLFRVTVPTAGNTRPFIAGGPVFSFMTTCELEGSSGSVSVSADCEDVEAEEKSFELSGKVEGGLDFAINGRVITVGAAYQHGFSDIFEDSDVRNRVISIFGAFGF